MIDEAIEHVVRAIVDHPDDVSVRLRAGRTGETYDCLLYTSDAADE